MALKDDIESIIQYHDDKAQYLKINHSLFDIYEGSLKQYVKDSLARQLSPEAYKNAVERLAPINVLKRILEKLSKIYQESPTRRVVGGGDNEAGLLDWYSQNFRVDTNLNLANEYFNMSKATLIQPYLHKGTPRLRAIQNDKFLVWSNDPVDPTSPTHIMTFHHKGTNRQEMRFHIWTDEEFLIVDGEGAIQRQEMEMLENPEGINPIGRLPYTYVNRSPSKVMPPADDDTLAMTVLLPLLLTDLNFASMFSLFSIIYVIGAKRQDLDSSPNSVWFFQIDEESDQQPTIGQINPQADIDKTLSLIGSQLSFWLETRGIKPGTIGQLTVDNAASGIAKIIDEADTSDDRKKQVQFFKEAEADMWELTMNNLHPFWVSRGMIENRTPWNPNAYVETDFAPQVPLQTRGQLVSDLKSEVDSMFTTQRRAIARLNPGMTDEEIDDLVEEIAVDNMVAVDLAQVPAEGEMPEAAEGDLAEVTELQAVSGEEVVEQKIAELLNGAQVASLLELLNQVAAGLLPGPTAKALIKASFGLDDGLIDDIVDPVVARGIIRPEGE